jgi:hypothetical protein
MKTIIVACHTLEDELNIAIKETGCEHPVLWIESGLHLYTESLNKRLQQELDRISNIERVLLAFGYCGNSLLGLISPKAELIFPRVDDCITLLLGSQRERKRISNEAGTYFLTKGWLEFESNIWQEYQYAIKKYGKERAERVFKQILAHYHRLGIIDTGAYELPDFLKLTEEIAETLKLRHEVIPGTISYLKKLLTGPWDNEFAVISPGEKVKLEHLRFD